MKAIRLALVGPLLLAGCVQLTPSTGIGPNLVAGRAGLTTVVESQAYRDLTRIVDCRPDGSFEFGGVPEGSGDRSDLQIMQAKDNA